MARGQAWLNPWWDGRCPSCKNPMSPAVVPCASGEDHRHKAWICLCGQMIVSEREVD